MLVECQILVHIVYVTYVRLFAELGRATSRFNAKIGDYAQEEHDNEYH